MGSYMYLICLAVFASLNCWSTVGKFTCYNYNPILINGTQPPSELRCPERCNCTYCAKEGEQTLEYKHDVDCSQQRLEDIPSMDTVPTDARFYRLAKNDISSLENNSFKTTPDLEYLLLDENKLNFKNIEIDAFRGLRKMTYLSLNKNRYLGQLLMQWFIDLVSLELLHIENCGISSLENDVFKHLTNLTKIDLSTNGIKYFHAAVFQNLSSLNNLFIPNNHISNIPKQAFAGSNKLQSISLHDNSLATISEDVGLQTLGELRILSVSYNKFSCDCNLVWFRHWIDKTNITFDDIGRTKCFSPGSKVYHNLMDFDPATLQCSKLIRILRIAIPSASAGVAIVIIASLLYYFRYDLRYWNQRRRLRKQYKQLDKQGPLPINGENIRYDAFVSYNSKDQQWVLSVLQPSLETERNFKLCVDYRDFIVGEAVVNNIADSVKYSRKVLLVVSKNFAKSEWCYFELEMARMRMFDNHEDILVVVLLEKVSAKDMPILLHKILTKKTYIEWKEHPEGQALFWAKLEAALLSPNCPTDRLLDNP